MWPSKRKKFIRNAHTTKKNVCAEFAHRKASATINASNTNAKIVEEVLFACTCVRNPDAKSVLRIYFAGMVA